MLDENQHESSLTLQPSSVNQYNWRQIIQRGFAIGLAIGLTVAIFAARDTIEGYAQYGYWGVFIISILGNATLILPAPSFAIIFAMGSILNPFWVGIVGGCGAALGEMTGYLAGFGGRGLIENQTYYQKLNTLMSKWGAWLIFALALIPNPIFDMGGIVAGALRIPWWKFLIAAAFGKSIRFIILAYLGSWSLTPFV